MNCVFAILEAGLLLVMHFIISEIACCCRRCESFIENAIFSLGFAYVESTVNALGGEVRV